MDKIKVGPWTLTEGGSGAYRAVAGTDCNHIAHRVAFVEKTPRVRIRPEYLGRGQWEDFLNWADGPKGSDCEDQESRDWCDQMLVSLGYELIDKPAVTEVEQWAEYWRLKGMEFNSDGLTWYEAALRERIAKNRYKLHSLAYLAVLRQIADQVDEHGMYRSNFDLNIARNMSQAVIHNTEQEKIQNMEKDKNLFGKYLT